MSRLDSAEDQLAVQDAYLALLHAQLPHGVSVRPVTHGKIDRVLNFESNGSVLFAAVLYKRWVSWYFRHPFLSTTNSDLILSQFPAAEKNPSGEIIIKLHNAADATAVIDWLLTLK